MKLDLKYIAFGISLLVVFGLTAQDIHFSQFHQTPQLLNPGATGNYEGKGRLIINYRNQWGVIGTSYTTYAASFDVPILKGKMNGGYLGIGGNFYKDAAGQSQFGNTIGSLSLAGVLEVHDKGFLSLGIQAGLRQFSADLSNATWGSQFNDYGFDTNLATNEPANTFSSKMYADIAAGVYYQLSNTTSSFLDETIHEMDFGIAVFHLNRPKQEFLGINEGRLPVKLVIQGAMEKGFALSPFAVVPTLFFAKQGAHTEFVAGMLVKISSGGTAKLTGFDKKMAIYLGGHYRWKDAIIGKLMFEIQDYMIGVSYDINVSSFSAVTNRAGSFEVSIKYTSNRKQLLHGHSR
ncbi:MAG: PorP/SprF family type IX secretion system membrane protein [Flavobacteriales bacterium]|nr:PorP/SprF family type IX secretion system membrane protein [Flavobacteriales bacterium]